MENVRGERMEGGYGESAAVRMSALRKLWMDGTDGQEDELEDVAKGKLQPPTNSEGEGSVVDRSDRGRGLESEDEDDGLVRGIEERGRLGEDEEMETLARRAGIRLPE